MKTNLPMIRSSRKQGFTLIEILVALSVTALMVTLMVNITIGVLNVWNRSSGSLTTGNQARTLMDQIAQDLQGAIFKRDGNIWLAATVQQDQTGFGDANMADAKWSDSIVKPRSNSGSLDLAANRTSLAAEDQNKLENIRFGQAGVWLRFFTNVSDTNADVESISAPRAVSYQLSRVLIGSTSSEQKSYVLYRSEVSPRLTFNTGYSITSSNYDLNTGSAANDSGEPTIRKPNASRIIANNVVDFGIRFLEKNTANELIEKFPVTRLGTGALVSAPTTVPVNYFVTSATPAYTSYGSTVTPTTGFPVVAEIMVRILTQEGVNKIQAFESGKVTAPAGTTAAEYWWTLAEQNSNVFVRRVEIKSTAL